MAETKISKIEAKERIAKLRELIDKYRYEYHVHDRSLVSDAVNDSLKHELAELEAEFPEFITPDSPTQRVGGEPLSEFAKVRHLRPMLSLNDSFTFEELSDWEERLKKLLPNAEWDYFAELKIDGLAISLIYEDGLLVRGATRGDGAIGEDVTQNIKTIEAIPLRLRGAVYQKGRVEVRGEVYLPKEEFKKLNQEREKAGLPPFANPRNIAAGSVRQLDPKITAKRRLSFMAWDLFLEREVATHSEKHQILEEMGFKVNKNNQRCASLAEVRKFLDYWQAHREKLPYEIDGAVINVNLESAREALGVVGKAPRGSIAYKFAAKEATSVIREIGLQVGRTGILTPVAELEPVILAGTTVSRATLHNADEIEKKDIRERDTVIIRKAGDIIPEVVKVILELRPKDTKPFKMPKNCPVCHSLIVRDPDGVYYRCPNKNCFAKRLRMLAHFAGKNGLDIEGLGPKIIEQLFNAGLIRDASDIFELKEGDVEPLERFAEKSAHNLVSAISARKKVLLWRLLTALSVPRVGGETARDLAFFIEHKAKLPKAYTPHRLLEAVRNWQEADYEEIPEIGPIVANGIKSFFEDKETQRLLTKLSEVGLEIVREERSTKANPAIFNKTFVFTGELQGFSREEARELVRSLGGRPSESVSSKTDYLVVGEGAGSKLEKARALKVRIISKEEFLKLIGRS